MAKKGTIENPITSEDLANIQIPRKEIIILSAVLKDGTCHYKNEINDGKHRGEELSVKGVGLFRDDMKEAFAEFNVHLAVIDDAFKYSKVKFGHISEVANHEIALLFSVTGFRVKGEDDNRSVVLIGTKYVSTGGRIELESPKIPLDNLSSYKWYNELRDVVDAAQTEVELYKNGKFDVEEDDEEDTRYTQKKMFDAGDEMQDEFAEAAL